MKILAALFISVFFLSFASYAESNISLEKILANPKIDNIAQSRQWLKLLHIERNWLGIKGTQVTDAKFLFSDSKNNSEKELRETLRNFLLPAAQFAKEIDNAKKEKVLDHSEHPICRFPARLKFLKNELKEFDTFWGKLPAVVCNYQGIYKSAINAKSVSFVFSSYYSDSPGSAFGHTFFRINRKSNNDHQELLDFGIGFAAQVTIDNPIAYALLGLVGGFNGIWTNLPYYYKVREYNDFESRDLWSYDLNLSEDELDTLILHLWEIGSHTYNYYFFTQNCAFHMLTALEAAAPRLHLTDHVPFYYVIPADSMKSLFYEPELVSNVTYRPSLRRVFEERYKLLDNNSFDSLKDFAKNLSIKDKGPQTTDKEYAHYLDSTLDLLSLKFPNLVNGNHPEIYALKEDILKKRANIEYITESLDIKPHDDDRPDHSHGSSRLSLNYNHNIKDIGATYRFAIHDLLDPSVGMPENSQLEFFNFSAKKYNNKFALEKFNLFKVFNLNPLNFYEKKLSWGLRFGSERMILSPKINPFYATGIETQVGYSFNLTNENRPWTFWSMAKADIAHASKSKNNQYGFFAGGYELGLLKRFNTKNALLFTFEKMHPSKLDSFEKIEFEYRTSFTQSTSLGLGLSKRDFRAEIFYYY